MINQPNTNPRNSGERSWFHAPATLDAAVIDPMPTIVLAEDNDILRETVALVLTKRGCLVRCAADGDQAWKLLCEAPFALLITDNEMPGLSGLELLRKMRSASLVQPAILMSGNMPWDVSDLRELLSPGTAVEKPFGINQLIAAISGLVVSQPKTSRVTPHFA